MSTKIVLGHPEAHEKLTARLLWKRTADSGYNDAGNVKEFVDATTRSLVTRARAEDGARHVNAEVVDVNHESFTFLLDERTPEQELLLRLARQLSDKAQTGTEGATATLLNAHRGRWYAIGAYNVANVAVTGSVTGELVEGEDYELDAASGRLRILEEAGVSQGESLNLTFDQPDLEFEQFETQYNALFYCDVIIEEHNQFHKMWLRRTTARGYLNVTEFPSQTGEFGQYRVKFTPSEPMTVLKRREGQTLPEHVESTEGAAHSSSSSSSSSATSSASSQSNSSASSSSSSGPQP